MQGQASVVRVAGGLRRRFQPVQGRDAHRAFRELAFEDERDGRVPVVTGFRGDVYVRMLPVDGADPFPYAADMVFADHVVLYHELEASVEECGYRRHGSGQDPLGRIGFHLGAPVLHHAVPECDEAILYDQCRLFAVPEHRFGRIHESQVPHLGQMGAAEALAYAEGVDDVRPACHPRAMQSIIAEWTGNGESSSSMMLLASFCNGESREKKHSQRHLS